MILISHRGNLTGSNPNRENSLPYVQEALDKGFDVEIDIWLNDGVFYLGHDAIQYEVTLDWLKERKNNLWLHCKNIEAIEWFNSLTVVYNYFWHQEDTVTLTSKSFIWAYPGKQPINRSIAVMPEIFNDDLNSCIGICSDYIQNYNQ
jgi:glycerophosphoryl diester phosphodiesterase